MRFIVSDDLNEDALAGKYIFLDSDFLSLLLTDVEALQQAATLARGGYLIVDWLIRFEFLRSAFVPTRRQLLEKFIDNEIFSPATEHQTIFTPIRENALTLSYLYAHQGYTSASVVDLLLASRALLHSPKSLIITGNRKDFPAFLFDSVGILNYEDPKTSNVRAYSVISFNRKKFDVALERWRSLT